MDRIDILLKLLKIKYEKDCSTLGENYLRSMIDDYYFSRDTVDNYLSTTFPEAYSSFSLDAEDYKKVKKSILSSQADLKEHFNTELEIDAAKNIYLDNLINLNSIEKMYLPKEYGYGFGAEIIIPIILTAIQSMSSIAAVIISIKQTQVMINQAENQQLKDITNRIDCLGKLLLDNNLEKDKKNDILSELIKLNSLYIEHMKKGEK